jgi:hypothetical protein
MRSVVISQHGGALLGGMQASLSGSSVERRTLYFFRIVCS